MEKIMDMTGEKNERKKTAHRNRYDGKSPVYSRSCGKYSRYKGRVYTFEKALYRYPTIQAGCADSGYRGTFRNTFDEFHNIRIDISMQIKEQKGFQVLGC